MSTFLQGIAHKAQRDPSHRFGNLYELLDATYLLECWGYLRKDAASGVDGVTARQYEAHLEDNIRDLVQRLKEKRYRAPHVRRRYIEKPDGRKRPLGLPTVEDKLVQIAVKRILEAIYEQDFLRCSYGYRPGKSAHDAVGQLTVKLQFGAYQHVVEADIAGFFEHLDHAWLIRMLALRIDDRALLRLIGKWLKAGILEVDGRVLHPQAGTPQGGVISPILANIYLHYALDLWFHKVVRRYCHGEACLIRYADDFVCAFEHADDAERFLRALAPRLEKFGLALAADKTQHLPFAPQAKTRFSFLGFEFYWRADSQGIPRVQRRTDRKKLRQAVQRLTVWCRQHVHLKLAFLIRRLNAKLRGYYNYYGITGNYPSLVQFYELVKRILFKWLNRRGQKRSMTWPGFKQMLEHFGLLKPRLRKTDSRAECRNCGVRLWITEARLPEEPGAGKPHAGIRAGAVG
jgi:RNA-directed DNA polymerase